MVDNFSSMCTPAKVYFAIFLVNILFMLFHRVRLALVFSKILFGSIWTYLLTWLCKKGYKSVSWFLVLLPFIMIAVVVVFGATAVSNMTKEADSVSKCGQKK
jgi:hypothetical protein